MKRILILLTFCILASVSSFLHAAKNKFTVVIDPGHGGRDGGAVRGKYKEKTINLAVALAVGKLIEDNFGDVKVVYTRKTDTFVDLNRRAEIANKEKANLFLSIHTNSTQAKSTTASGADTYILGLARSAENLEVAKRENSVILLEDDYSTKYEGFDPESPESYIIFEFMANKYMEQSLELASFIQTDFRNTAKRKDRGVRQAGFLVLRESGMPSVLIELGFINNATEARYLDSQAGQTAMARSIYTGFRKYKANFDKMQGNNSNIKAEEPKAATGSPARNNTTTGKDKPSNDSNTNSNNKGEVEYRIQFLTTPKKLPNNSTQFKGLSPVDYYVEGGLYKYTYGATTNYNEILKTANKLKPLFKDSFLIKFKDGKRIK